MTAKAMLRGIARGGNIAGHVRSNSVGVHRCLQQFLYGPVVFSRTACNQALRASQSPRSPMLRSFGRGTLSTAGFFAWLISCAWLFEEYCYEWVSSSGPSMYPTLPSETKYLIISKRHRLGRDMKVGDLVHFKHPNFRHLAAGKRIIGMPGDFVVRDPDMSPTVGGMTIPGNTQEYLTATAAAARNAPSLKRQDGKDAAEKYTGSQTGNREEAEKAAVAEEPLMIQVPPGHVWVAGDNLSWSRDSRFFGPVPMGLILGKIIRHSSPGSDWIIDTIDSSREQLTPVLDRADVDLAAVSAAGDDRAAAEGRERGGWKVEQRLGGGMIDTSTAKAASEKPRAD